MDEYTSITSKKYLNINIHGNDGQIFNLRPINNKRSPS